MITTNMNALQSIIKRNQLDIYLLENDLREYQKSVKVYYQQSDENSVEGKIAFIHLNIHRNTVRSIEAELKTLRRNQKALKIMMRDMVLQERQRNHYLRNM